jgi:hypothetical protein
MFERERPPFPGTPEKYRNYTLVPAISRDGIALEFSVTVDLEKLDEPTKDIEFGTKGAKTTIPLKVIRDVGNGEVVTGLEVLANIVSTLDYESSMVGDQDPLYEKFIYPYYGGPESFEAAMKTES